MAWQLSLNAIASASVIAMMALGFSAIYSVSKFFDFAYAIIFTCSSYFAFLSNAQFGLPLPISIFLGIAVATVLGCLFESLFYRRLKKRFASPVILLLASLGIYIVLQNVISLIFGDELKLLNNARVEEGISIFGGRLTMIQIITIFASLFLIVAMTALEKFTTAGRLIRAVANDPGLADVTGVNSHCVVLLTYAIGSALAGVAGVLVGLDVGMTPTMGLNFFMMSVVAAVIGGVGNTLSVAMGALFLGLALNFGVWKIGSEWQQAIAFLILLVFLFIRPQGFLGKPIQKSSI